MKTHDLYEVEGHEGLVACRACGGAEGSLPTECPGERMTPERCDDVYAGAKDYRGGTWVDDPSGRVASHREILKKKYPGYAE